VFKSIFKAKESVKVHRHPKMKIVITYSTLVINPTNFIEDILIKVNNRCLGSTLTLVVQLTKFWGWGFFSSSTVPQLLSVFVCF